MNIQYPYYKDIASVIYALYFVHVPLQECQVYSLPLKQKEYASQRKLGLRQFWEQTFVKVSL